MKRISSRFAAAAMVVFAGSLVLAAPVFAGGTKEAGEPSASSSATAPTKLVMLIDNQTALQGIRAVAAAAEKRLNIALSIEVRPGGAAGDNIVRTRLAAGDMDDINFYNSGSLFLELNPSKFFVNLANEPYMRDVIQSFKSTVSVGDGVYAAPGQSVMAGGWLYNKRVYSRLGLAVPTTWSQLIANSEKIKAAGTLPIIASYKDAWTAQVILLADYYNLQHADPSFAADYTAHRTTFADNPAALEGFQKLQQVWKLGLINKDAATTTYEQALAMLLSGQGAQYPMLTFAFANMAKMDPAKAEDIGFFAQPGDSAGSNGVTLWMPAGFSIYNQGKRIDAAKRWVAFFESKEGIAAFLTAQKPDGPFALKGVALPDDILPGVKDMLPYVDSGRTAPALEFLSPLKGPELPQICVADGLGLESPLQAAKDYDKNVQEQALQLGLPGW